MFELMERTKPTFEKVLKEPLTPEERWGGGMNTRSMLTGTPVEERLQNVVAERKKPVYFPSDSTQIYTSTVAPPNELKDLPPN